MKLELAVPSQVKEAQKMSYPLIIPVGTIEYHGPHCAYGCDGLIAQGLAEKLATERAVVIAPTIWYSPASYAVAGMSSGTVHVDCDCFEAYVGYTLRSLICSGWKSIYMLIHHQYEDENLLPMTLACMKAGKKVIFEYMESTKGMGWWGKNEFEHFYDDLQEGEMPWNWITVLPCMSKAAQKATGYDHAGKYEASMLMALCPEALKLNLLPQSDEWFIRSAKDASLELGSKMVELSMKDLRTRIR
jgi:creatinine amidohydrolase